MTIPARILAIVIAVLIVGIGGKLAWDAWQTGRAGHAQARVDASQGKAKDDSGKDAVATVAASGAREAAIAEVTRANETEIRNAKGADAGVDPAVRDAGLRSLCRRASAQNDPKCVRLAAPGGMDGRRD